MNTAKYSSWISLGQLFLSFSADEDLPLKGVL